MFTNWLTGTSSGSASSNAAASGQHVGGTSTPALGMGGLMSTPPDVVLEVGPAPGGVRFVAHSLVLGMHSGYLRSAIRLDENVQHAAAGSDLLLYLGNVTAEQFAPLLTYMYTGYLDLNVDNIFGVLLATHVLHMPRALEICRSYLARAQSEGYLGSGLPSIPAPNTTTSAPPANASSGKIIRPIPSKATLPNFGFLPLTHQLPLPLATATAATSSNAADTFKQLPRSYGTPAPTSPRNNNERARHEERSDEIEVARTPSAKSAQHNDDEDEEVFIDSNTETDVEADAISVTSRTSRTSHKQRAAAANAKERETAINVEAPAVARTERPKETQRRDAHRTQSQSQPTTSSKSNKRDKRKHARHKTHSGAASGLQVAKAPIPASQLDAAEGSKVIIDVASCDGPVRFRRILNTAYGHKPDDYAVLPERTQQSVSLSFHQQMAKTISQQRQLAHANEESENSESSNGGGGAAAGSSSGKQSGSKSGNNEIYVCVYCKHTFKSQYCYQKHAKRHLNPLSLSCAAAAAASGAVCAVASEREKLSITAKNGAASAESGGAPVYGRVPLPIGAGKQSATELLRREVRPLDMNVQYYPCKTCGSKFPSYYFVHKHRKMCHADEEADNAAGRGGNGSGHSANDSDEKAAERKAD